jgi:hypothetical protein
MSTWESLDPEAQRHWLALAEAKHGMPVTWIDVEPARREGLLEIVNTELCPDRWEDETLERKQELLAIIETDDEQTAIEFDDEQAAQLIEKQRNALQIIIDDLEVDCTPDQPDWRALFLAHARRYGPGNVGSQGRPPFSAWKHFQLARDFVVERNKPAAQPDRRPRSEADVLRTLVKTERWATAPKKERSSRAQ